MTAFLSGDCLGRWIFAKMHSFVAWHSRRLSIVHPVFLFVLIVSFTLLTLFHEQNNIAKIFARLKTLSATVMIFRYGAQFSARQKILKLREIATGGKHGSCEKKYQRKRGQSRDPGVCESKKWANSDGQAHLEIWENAHLMLLLLFSLQRM